MALKQLTIRVEPEEADALEKRWRKAGFTKLQDAGLHAFRTSFETGPEPTVPAKYRPHVKELEEVLSSGNREVIDAVARTITVAVKHLQALRELQRRESGR